MFLICSSLVLDLSSLSSFCAWISSYLYCSISSASFLWKWSCSFTFSYSIRLSRLDFVCWIFSSVFLGAEEELWCDTYLMSGSEGYFCMRKLYYYYEALLLHVLLL